jgi:hypothetical protein
VARAAHALDLESGVDCHHHERKLGGRIRLREAAADGAAARVWT